MSNSDRLQTLAKFIRSQAMLTDGRTPKPGPGEVRLNHEAAILVADALDELLRKRIFLEELTPRLAAMGVVT